MTRDEAKAALAAQGETFQLAYYPDNDHGVGIGTGPGTTEVWVLRTADEATLLRVWDSGVVGSAFDAKLPPGHTPCVSSRSTLVAMYPGDNVIEVKVGVAAMTLTIEQVPGTAVSTPA